MENAQDRAWEQWRVIFRPSAAYRIVLSVLGILGIAFALWRIWQAVRFGTYREVGYLASFSFLWTIGILSTFYRVEISSKAIRTRGSFLLYPRIWTIFFDVLESVTVRRGIMGVVVWFRTRNSRWSKETRGYGTGFYKALAEIRAALPPSIPLYDPDGVFVTHALKERDESIPISPKDR